MLQSYKNLTTNELVPKEEGLAYVLEKLNIDIQPIKGIYTFEQQEFLDMVEEWYFSGNWVLTNDEEE